ncbi:hypothetical protein [Pedobacter sp.]|uniref:hypothetical protein n=1 Tax=Pedobacter sp. TaxID=1411316 RepID=UPI00396CCBD1
MKAEGIGRELPIFNIQGTAFLVDVAKCELREKGNEVNVISFFYMDEMTNTRGYKFVYDKTNRSISQVRVMKDGDVIVRVPEMVDLDPVGMAKKYGMKLSEIKKKTDFEVMVDQKAYQKRLSGELPVVDIKGYTYYVDIERDCLVPKDDDIRPEISFDDLDIVNVKGYAETMYMIGYNTAKEEIEPVNMFEIQETNAIPKDTIALIIPFYHRLDPIGYNILVEDPVQSLLKGTNVNLHIKAKVEKWSDIESVLVCNGVRTKQKGSGKKEQEK